MRVVVSILLICVASVNAYYYGFPFGSVQEPRVWFGLYVNVSIGTPPQLARLRLGPATIGRTPVFAGGKGCSEGSYDVNKSTTFVQDVDSGTPQYSYGLDTLSFASGYTHKNVTLTAANEICWNGPTWMELAYYTCSGTFICNYLSTQTSPVLVLSFKQVGNTVNTPTFGTVVMAETPKDVCKTDWTYYNAVNTFPDFALPVDNIKIGNFNQKTPNLNVSITLGSYDIVVLDPLYSKIVETLGIVNNNEIDYKIDCSTNTSIELTVDGKSLTISSDVYIDKDTQDANGNCQARIVKGKETFELPITVLAGKCLLYDYGQQQPRIGIATSSNK